MPAGTYPSRLRARALCRPLYPSSAAGNFIFVFPARKSRVNVWSRSTVRRQRLVSGTRSRGGGGRLGQVEVRDRRPEVGGRGAQNEIFLYFAAFFFSGSSVHHFEIVAQDEWKILRLVRSISKRVLASHWGTGNVPVGPTLTDRLCRESVYMCATQDPREQPTAEKTVCSSLIL